MKIIIFSCVLLIWGCTNKGTTVQTDDVKDTVAVDNTRTDPTPNDTVYNDPGGMNPKVYSNERFKDVTVEKTADNTYVIKGKGQIFEANFGWVIEDGHYELQSGNQMTDAGAPAWGNFTFAVTAAKKDPNTTLHLIIFESSPKDGSRQYELPLLLY